MANGAPISALADVAKATMLKLRFSLTTGRSIRLILYERICGLLGTVVVGLLFTLCQLALPTPQALLTSQLLLCGQVVCWRLRGCLSSAGCTLSLESDRSIESRMSLLGLDECLRRPIIAGELTMTSLAQIAGLRGRFHYSGGGNASSRVFRSRYSSTCRLIFFVSSLPIFYLGWGAREAAVIATLGTTGSVTSGEAVALSVTFGIVVFLASLPGAIFWLMRPSMRAATRAEAKQR